MDVGKAAVFFVVVNLSNILYTIKDSYSTEQLVTL